LGTLKYDKRDCAASQVLLIPDVFVSCHQYLKARFFGNLDQLTVCELFPAPDACFLDRMPD